VQPGGGGDCDRNETEKRQKREDKKDMSECEEGERGFFSFRIAVECRIRKSELGQTYQALK
jgi:hypothetical protein